MYPVKKLSLLILLLVLLALRSFSQSTDLTSTLDYINKTLDDNPDMVKAGGTGQVSGVNNYAVSVSNAGNLQVRKIYKSAATGKTCSYVYMIAFNDIDTTFTYYHQKQADSPALKHLYINCKCDTVQASGQPVAGNCTCIKSYYDKVNSTGDNCAQFLFPIYDRIEIVFSSKDSIEGPLFDAFTHLVHLLATGAPH